MEEVSMMDRVVLGGDSGSVLGDFGAFGGESVLFGFIEKVTISRAYFKEVHGKGSVIFFLE